VILVPVVGEPEIMKLADLLPRSFSKADL